MVLKPSHTEADTNPIARNDSYLEDACTTSMRVLTDVVAGIRITVCPICTNNHDLSADLDGRREDQPFCILPGDVPVNPAGQPQRG